MRVRFEQFVEGFPRFDMSGQRIVSPERMLRMLTPGFRPETS